MSEDDSFAEKIKKTPSDVISKKISAANKTKNGKSFKERAKEKYASIKKTIGPVRRHTTKNVEKAVKKEYHKRTSEFYEKHKYKQEAHSKARAELHKAKIRAEIKAEMKPKYKAAGLKYKSKKRKKKPTAVRGSGVTVVFQSGSSRSTTRRKTRRKKAKPKRSSTPRTRNIFDIGGY